MKYFEMLGEDYLKESDRALRELERSAQELENFKFN